MCLFCAGLMSQQTISLFFPSVSLWDTPELKRHNPTTRRYFTSTDVTFFESTPYFVSTSSIKVQAIVPLPTIVESSVVEGAANTFGVAPHRPLQVYNRRP